MKHSTIFTPKVLSGIAIVGVVVTAIFVAKETGKAKAVMEEEFKDYPPEKQTLKVSARKVARVTWQYKGSIASAMLTIYCIARAQKMNEKEIAGLTATIGYLAANRDKAEKWINSHTEDLWPDTEYELEKTDSDSKNLPAGDICRKLPIEDTGNGKEIFREMYTGRWFYSNTDAVEQAIRRFLDRFDDGQTLTLNDFYYELGLPATMFGATVGWNPDHSLTRNLGIYLTDVIFDTKEKAKYRLIHIDPGSFPYNYFRS